MTTAFGTGVTGPDGRALDQIQLSGVSARGYHGVLPSERQTGQEFRADVVLYMDTRPAAAGDDLAQTVSYADVAADVHDILKGDPADLIETVAERIAAAVLARPLIEAVDVRVHKPHAPIPVPFADVEVAIRRDRTRMPVVAVPAGLLAAHPVPEPAAEVAPAEPEPQDFEPVARPVAEEPEQFRPEPYQSAAPAQFGAEAFGAEQFGAENNYEAFEAEPLAERAPSAPAAETPAEEPEPLPVPELIAPEPLGVIPAAWELQAEAPAEAEQRPAKEPVFQQGDQFQPEERFQPEEQFSQGDQFPQAEQFKAEQFEAEQFKAEPAFEPEPTFEPVQQYESLQGLDQRPGPDQPNAFEPQQSYEPAQPAFQQQSFEQPQYEQPQYEQPQRDAQPNQYDQMFEQQYDQGDMEATRVSAAVPDSAVGQPEPAFAQEQPYQAEPRDRFDEMPAGYVDVVIAIGANLGDPQATMRSAVAELDRVPGVQITDVSPLARTAAVGGPEDQPDYLNAVLLARTTLSARGLLHACLEVENLHGRTRDERWGARTLDVDLITYGTLTDSAEDIEIPHPRAHERAFVLEPWSQIAPEAMLPGLGGGPVGQLAATAPDRTGIRWLALDWLTDPEPEQGGAGTTASNHPAVPDDAGQDAHPVEMPPALPPSLPPSGRPQASPGGPVVEVPGGGQPQTHHSGPVDLEGPNGSPQDPFQGGHPQAYSSGPVPGPGGSVPIPHQAQAAPVPPRPAQPIGVPGNGSVVPPPEEALVPAPIAPRAVRDTAHEEPERETLPPASQVPAKPVFAPVNPSRQQSGVFPPMNGAPQEPAAPVFAPVGNPPQGAPDPAANGHSNGQPAGRSNGQLPGYDNDHTVIRVPGYATEQSIAPSDGPIDSVPSWVPVRDERGRDA